LLDDVLSRKVSKIYVTYEDRLARFGFDLLSWVCGIYEKEIVSLIAKTPLLLRRSWSRT
jgi:predicted site-specific integrase-resolvase